MIRTKVFSSGREKEESPKFSKNNNLSDRTKFFLFSWNNFRNLKKHNFNKYNLSGIILNFDKSIQGLEDKKIFKAMVDYDRALESKKSKLSTGDLFKFNIDSFFKFSSYDIKKIKSNKHSEGVLDPGKSLFECFCENENYFDYEKSKIILSEKIINYYKKFFEKTKKITINKIIFDESIISVANQKIQNFFEKYHGKLKLYDCEFYEFKGNVEDTETIENFLYWAYEFIEDSPKIKNIFHFYHLRADFFFDEFYKYLESLNRIRIIYDIPSYENYDGKKLTNYDDGDCYKPWIS